MLLQHVNHYIPLRVAHFCPAKKVQNSTTTAVVMSLTGRPQACKVTHDQD